MKGRYSRATKGTVNVTADRPEQRRRLSEDRKQETRVFGARSATFIQL